MDFLHCLYCNLKRTQGNGLVSINPSSTQAHQQRPHIPEPGKPPSLTESRWWHAVPLYARQYSSSQHLLRKNRQPQDGLPHSIQYSRQEGSLQGTHPLRSVVLIENWEAREDRILDLACPLKLIYAFKFKCILKIFFVFALLIVLFKDLPAFRVTSEDVLMISPLFIFSVAMM